MTMFGDGIDLENSSSYRKKKKDSFQSELHSTLKDRRSRGLSADITSPEEESDDEDFLSQFTKPKSREDRPQSAKRRQQPSYLKGQRSDWTPGLGDTMRPGTNMFTIRNTDQNYEDSDDDETDMTLTLGKSSKSPRSHDKGSVHLPKTGATMSKEDIIFGRKGSSPRDSKSPKPESREKGPWQPPSFQKTHLPETDSSNRSTSPVGSKGRRTPTFDPLLESINEAPTPRSRKQAAEKDEDHLRPKPKPRGRKEDGDGSSERKTPTSELSSARSESTMGRKTPTITGRKTPTGAVQQTPSKAARKSVIDTGRKATSEASRKTPTSDIFGKSGKSSSLDFLSDEKEEEETIVPTPRQRQSAKTAGKSGTKSPLPVGRKSPMPVGRKSPVPVGRKSPVPAGRKTVARDGLGGTKTAVRDGRDKTEKTRQQSKEEEEISSRRASVLDFLTEDDPQPKQKPRKSRLQRSDSADSITEELVNREEGSEVKGRRSRPQSRGTPKLHREHSNSSICEDIQGEPSSVSEGAHPDQPAQYTRSDGPQRSDKQQADDAINSVAGVQDKLGMTYIEPDKDNKESRTKKVRTKSAKERPKPRYPSKPGEVIDIESPATFEDTVSIRNAIFAQWYKDRSKKSKEAIKEKKKQEAAEEEKKRKEKEDKLLENKASYNAWMEKKESVFKEKGHQKREEEAKKEKELEEKMRKKKDAEKTFNTWKERKDTLIQTSVHKVKDEERTKEQEERQKKREKQKQNSTAYHTWMEKKETVIKSKVKEEKTKVKEETLKEKQQRKQKEREAVKQYEEWMRKKEEQELREKKRRRQQRLQGEEEFRPAWSPANKTIPFGR